MTVKLDTAKAEAEIAKIAAEKDFYVQNSRVAAALAEQEEITLRIRQRNEDKILAQDEYHRVYVFDDDVDDESVRRCVSTLTTLTRNNPGCDIEIQLNTGGGSIFAGFALIDFLRDLRKRGHKIKVTVFGCAASMGAVILQAADERVIGENALLLIHEGSMYTGGDSRQVEDDVAMFRKLQSRILKVLAERATMTETKIKNKWTRTDWWLDAQEALDAGFVDAIL